MFIFREGRFRLNRGMWESLLNFVDLFLLLETWNLENFFGAFFGFDEIPRTVSALVQVLNAINAVN